MPGNDEQITFRSNLLEKNEAVEQIVEELVKFLNRKDRENN